MYEVTIVAPKIYYARVHCATQALHVESPWRCYDGERDQPAVFFVSFPRYIFSLLKSFTLLMIMQAQYRPLPYARLNSFHGPKRQLLGHKAGQAPPAWRTAFVAPNQVGVASVSKGKVVQEQGSRIFLSRLPVDVGEKDVEVSDHCGFQTHYFLIISSVWSF